MWYIKIHNGYGWVRIQNRGEPFFIYDYNNAMICADMHAEYWPVRIYEFDGSDHVICWEVDRFINRFFQKKNHNWMKEGF